MVRQPRHSTRYISTRREALFNEAYSSNYTPEISEANHGSLMLFPGIHHISTRDIRGEPWFANQDTRQDLSRHEKKPSATRHATQHPYTEISEANHVNIITYVLPMSTFNGIVSEFPDIRIDCQCQPSTASCLSSQISELTSPTHKQYQLTEYIWELRHTNRLPMSTFNGIVSEFPDIRIDFFRRNAAHNRRLLVS
ncbi:hypothetical protein H9Q74_000007 [Fusarium xylarioides]|nr:hypothetical protein H9Q74_000007 [Fusarium xylarioides]